MPLQREDGQVRGHDDDHGEKRRAPHFHGGAQHGLGALHLAVHLRLVEFTQAPEDVLHHNHRAVHDDAEIHGP